MVNDKVENIIDLNHRFFNRDHFVRLIWCSNVKLEEFLYAYKLITYHELTIPEAVEIFNKLYGHNITYRNFLRWFYRYKAILRAEKIIKDKILTINIRYFRDDKYPIEDTVRPFGKDIVII